MKKIKSQQLVAFQNCFHGIVNNFKTWPKWWKSLSIEEKIFPLCFALAYLTILGLIGGLRPDHIQMMLALMAFLYGGSGMRRVFQIILPFILVAIIYDSMRFYADFIRSSYIHVKEPYLFDLKYFGINTPSGRLTPNEYWQLNTHWILDLITGFAYLVFIGEFAIVALLFRFIFSQTMKNEKELILISKKLAWSFFFVNMIGYTMYYWYPASPPWYVSLYGLGPARLDVPPNPAGCLRFDMLLGTHFFSGFYGKSADVHGAIPSLHVAYPLLAFLYSLKAKRLQVFTFLFYVVMCFSAVYLNHHYILDLMWGSSYALLVFFGIERFCKKK